MKHWKVVFIIFGMMYCLSACRQPTDEEMYYKIQQKISTMESYQCTVKIYIDNGKEEVEYVFQQIFKAPNQYRLEVLAPSTLKGNLTIYNGKTAWLYHPSINQVRKIDNFNQSQEQMMFIGYFLKNYITSKESVYETETLEGKDYFVLSTKIPGGNHYFSQQELWIEKQQMIPEKLYIYDAKGKTRFKVYYEDFIYNPVLDENLFHLSLP
ncbi:germination lipoprotein GerS-related protein [Clostridium formicaceticum]|uniref:Sporulation protein YdcC n=1 Tax=Clostridium formicaceticum TaxID=1497 RepID=A0AAC9WHR0_9CLOT|nr:germination lipoprotein GerS-related protein [Clostridium formicaceticum]AOY74839.1 hypothetical protein BJL90_02025 [Clostridium formicaceticum]ARE89236.1 Sporulation protein YdcC [Clostridium formicaceticum]